MRKFKFRAWNGDTMRYNVTPWQHDFVIGTGHWRCLKSASFEDGIAEFKVDGYLFSKIMQCTGVKDKSGKDIYEGDIIAGMGFVEWIDKDARFGFNIGGEMKEVEFWELTSRDMVIIGNIYENPKLLSE